MHDPCSHLRLRKAPILEVVGVAHFHSSRQKQALLLPGPEKTACSVLVGEVGNGKEAETSVVQRHDCGGTKDELV